MIDQLKEVLVEILHTRDGSRVVLHCLWHGTPKVSQGGRERERGGGGEREEERVREGGSGRE